MDSNEKVLTKNVGRILKQRKFLPSLKIKNNRLTYILIFELKNDIIIKNCKCVCVCARARPRAPVYEFLNAFKNVWVHARNFLFVM